MGLHCSKRTLSRGSEEAGADVAAAVALDLSISDSSSSSSGEGAPDDAGVEVGSPPSELAEEEEGAKDAAKPEVVGDEKLENSEEVEGWLSEIGSAGCCGMVRCVGRTPFWCAEVADVLGSESEACTRCAKTEKASCVETGDIAAEMSEGWGS